MPLYRLSGAEAFFLETFFKIMHPFRSKIVSYSKAYNYLYILYKEAQANSLCYKGHRKLTAHAVDRNVFRLGSNSHYLGVLISLQTITA